MDKETRLVPTQVTSALASADATIVPVAIDELTTKVIAALDVIAAIIPDLRTPHPRTAKKVRGGRTVPRNAIVSILAMVESSHAIREMNLLDTARAHEILEFDDGFRVLDERLETLRRQVRYTVEARWAELASGAMDAYHMARRLAKEPRYAELAAHVATIRRRLGRTNEPKGPKKTRAKRE